MSTDELLIESDASRVMTLTINRPDAGNALTPAVQQAMIEALARAGDDLRVRAVVVRGAGERHFCTGADLRADRSAPPLPDGAPERPTGSVGRGLESRHGAQQLMVAVLDCPKPVVAAVNGTAAGIGAHLALASDFVIAKAGTRFIFVHVKRGLLPGGAGIYLLPRLVGIQRAKELLMFGDDVPVDAAHQMGLVNRVVPADGFDAEVAAWARRLASGPTVTLGLVKRLVNGSFDADRTAALREEALAQEVNTRSHDATEGVAAFVERRAPHYHGW